MRLRDFLKTEGYTDLVELSTGELAGIIKFKFKPGFGLTAGMTKHGYRIRYTFNREYDAYQALMSWNGDDHPHGNWVDVVGNDEYGVRVDKHDLIEYLS